MVQSLRANIVISAKLRQWSYHYRCSSTMTSSTAEIVKGPSLLRTSLATRPRPSLLYLPGLRSLPVWTQQQQPSNSVSGDDVMRDQQIATTTTTRVAYGDPTVSFAVEHLESNWEAIWREYQSVAPGLASDYQTDTEHSKTLHRGGWDWHTYMSKGTVESWNDTQRAWSSLNVASKTLSFTEKFPTTTGILSELRQKELLFEGTPFGYAFFSTLHGQSIIASHTAPMNLRLRIHLALSVPTTSEPVDKAHQPSRPGCAIRIGDMTRTWHEGKCLVFDDAYEHEVWNDTSQPRVILLVDIWHPDITRIERHEIMSMFDTAKQKGWLT